HQVIAPEANEALVETGGQTPVLDRSIEAVAPQAPRFSVVEPGIDPVFTFTAAPRREPAERAFADEYPAGEDVGLDEIHAGGVGLEQVVAHSDELDRRTSAGLQG